MKHLEPQVLDYIKRHGPATVEAMMKALGANEKVVRNAIDYWRRPPREEPIWLDRARGFWWRDDISPDGTQHERGKRAWVAA